MEKVTVAIEMDSKEGGKKGKAKREVLLFVCSLWPLRYGRGKRKWDGKLKGCPLACVSSEVEIQ